MSTSWIFTRHISGCFVLVSGINRFIARKEHLRGYVTPRVGNLTEEKSLCVQRGSRYNNFGSHPMFKVEYNDVQIMT
jgi:hypothetical protein